MIVLLLILLLIIAFSPYIDISNDRVILWYNNLITGERKFVIIK